MKNLIIALALVVPFVACKQRRETGSEVKWGHLKHLNENTELIYLPPGSSIAVCGRAAPMVKKLVANWARTIGRDTLLTLKDCNTSATKVLTIYEHESPHAQQRCRHFYPNGGAGGFREGNDLVFCVAFTDLKFEQALLHELGHSWGLCDQYTSDLANSDNCSAVHSGPKDPNSAMGAYKAVDITADDIEGMKALAARSDIPANAKWQEALAQAPAANQRFWYCGFATDEIRACLLDDRSTVAVVVQGQTFMLSASSRPSSLSGSTDYYGMMKFTNVPGVGEKEMVLLSVSAQFSARLFHMPSGSQNWIEWSDASFRLAKD